jgi:hypothetical protein
VGVHEFLKAHTSGKPAMEAATADEPPVPSSPLS